MATRFTPRAFTKAIAFNGSSQYVTLDNFVPATASFSLAFWLKPNAIAANNRLVDWQDSGPANGFTITTAVVAGSPNNIQFAVKNVSTTVAAINSGTVLTGRWSFVTATYEVNSVKFYINGAQVGSTDTSATMTAASATLTIGRRAGSSANYTACMMDEFMFWNSKVLTAAEIAALYYSYAVPSGLSVYLKFDDDVTDSSGNGNNGTAQGTPTYSADTRFASRASA